jgi:hypothetical protein
VLTCMGLVQTHSIHHAQQRTGHVTLIPPHIHFNTCPSLVHLLVYHLILYLSVPQVFGSVIFRKVFDSCRLGCDAVSLNEYFLTFRINIISSCLQSKHPRTLFLAGLMLKAKAL